MKKIKLLCVLMCALLLISSVSFSTGAKDTETLEVGTGKYEIETYEQLRELLKSLETLDTTCDIVLQSDIYQSDNKNDYELVVPANRTVNLDLNGYSIIRKTQGNDTALFRIKSDAELVMYDSSASQTGSCTFSEGYSNYYKAVFMNEGGVLKIEGGYYEIVSPFQQGECSVIRTTSGITEIYDGTFDSSSSYVGDTISVGHDAYFYDAPQVYICGGDFYGKYQSIDISPMNNFLPYGHLFPNVYVMGGNFYICNKGTDKITPGFCYCNNGWGRVIIAEGTVYATSLNSVDRIYLTGSTKKLTSHTVDDFTGGYYEVSAPPMIMPSGEDKYGEFYYDRLALLCSKEVTRNYNEETYLKFKEQFDSIRNTLDTIYVGELETESPEIKLINRTTNMERITWYICDEASFNGTWTHLGDYDNVVQMQLPERPEEGKSLLVRCVVTYSDLSTYQDIIRVEYEPLKTAETVTSVELTGLTTPADGTNPDFDLTPAEDGYYINGIFWTDYTNSGSPVAMKETDTFEAGHTYELQVWLRTNDGYKFRTGEDEYIDIVAYIDGEEAEVSEAGNEIAAILYMEFKIPESRVISEVDVINVDTPYAGRTPDFDAFCVTHGCNVSSVKWYDITDGGYVQMGEDDTFIKGHTYRVDVMVETEGDYTFLMVDRYNEAWGYINGIRAIAAAADEDTWLQLGLVFAPCEEDSSKIVSEFEIFDIEKPVAGNLPDTEAFSTTPGCEVAEVKWYDFTDGTHVELPENTPFAEGKIYRVVVTVETGAGYKFLMEDGYNEAVGYIDGTEAISYGSHDDFLLEVALEFVLGEAGPDKPVITGLLGDADCDGKVNVKDATAIQKHVAGLITLSETGTKLADVDVNANVNIKDATAIQKCVAGIETGFAIGESVKK